MVGLRYYHNFLQISVCFNYKKQHRTLYGIKMHKISQIKCMKGIIIVTTLHDLLSYLS